MQWTGRRRSGGPDEEPVEAVDEPVEDAPIDEDAFLGDLEERREPAPQEFRPELPAAEPSTLEREVGRVRPWLRSLAGWRAATSWRSALSQEDVARAMGTTQSAVARIESGLADPKLTTLVRYAAACGFRLSWMLEPLDVAALWAPAVDVGALSTDWAPAVQALEKLRGLPRLNAEQLNGMVGVITNHDEPAELRGQVAQALAGLTREAYR